MALHVLLFRLLLAGCCAYAAIAGGRSERTTAVIFLTGYLLTLLFEGPMLQRFAHFQWTLGAVDLAMWIAILPIALRSPRYWPLWIAAFQFLQMISHLTALAPGTLRLAYAIAAQMWAYPMLIILAVATLRHRIRRSMDRLEA
jgi:hypothetical protein